jgi:hypothetical protein
MGTYGPTIECIFARGDITGCAGFRISLNFVYLVAFEVFTAVVMKSTISWDITPCSPLSVNRRFGGTYRPHLQGRKNKFSKKPTWKQVSVISQKTVLFVNIDQNFVQFSSDAANTIPG